MSFCTLKGMVKKKSDDTDRPHLRWPRAGVSVLLNIRGRYHGQWPDWPPYESPMNQRRGRPQQNLEQRPQRQADRRPARGKGERGSPAVSPSTCLATGGGGGGGGGCGDCGPRCSDARRFEARMQPAMPCHALLSLPSSPITTPGQPSSQPGMPSNENGRSNAPTDRKSVV